MSLFCSDWSLCLSAYYSLSAFLPFYFLLSLLVFVSLSLSFCRPTPIFSRVSYLSLYISMSVCFLLSTSFCSRFSLFASDSASLYICLPFFPVSCSSCGYLFDSESSSALFLFISFDFCIPLVLLLVTSLFCRRLSSTRLFGCGVFVLMFLLFGSGPERYIL